MSKNYSLELDAIAAHLDRGWDRLHAGDPAGARVSAARILELSPESPEALTLMGAIAASEGDAEEAMDSFRQAMDQDPEYLDAVLYAAGLAIHTLGDWKHGLELCKQGEPLAVDPTDRLDLFLMQAEALLVAGDPQGAGGALAQIPAPPYPDPGHALRAGRAWLEVGNIDRAVAALDDAADDEDTRAEAQYMLGIAREQQGRPLEGLKHFLEVHRLNRCGPAPPWAPSLEAFEQVIQRALEALPEALRASLADLPLEVADLPPLELVAEGFDPWAMVLVASLGAEGGGPERAPTAIFVYKRNVERAAGSLEELPTALGLALEQELAFLLGDED
jgi:tetratricopeptide (TPR) repeat protein